jgi:tRNA A-37 threonylcarbamoyl transferase component Bud32
VLLVRLVVVALVDVLGRPRPAVVPYLYGWAGYAHPSAAAAVLSVTLVGAGYSLIPGGRWRTVVLWVGGAAVAGLCLARVYLGVDHASDALFAALAAWAAGTIAFRIFCPEEVFPVAYRRGRAAHLEIDERREQTIRDALEEQADMQLLVVEPFGEESSGGSTPLRIRARRDRDGYEEVLFAKLYSAAHLQADRWYKLGRTIMYGALEDEFAFNSVRQLVEHEDYMLRLFKEAGVSSVEPRGFVELIAEREYLIMMTMLERAEEADEDADVDESVIDDGLSIVRKMWDHGLAHRDIKPANVLIHDGRVSLIDVAFGQMRPSPWRQAVDLANMMLVLALSSDPDLVYQRATEQFTPDEIGEAFAAARGPAIPRQLREKLKEDERDLIDTFRTLAPTREPIAIQRWTLRRIALTARTTVIGAVLVVLLAINLANPHAP